MYRLLESVSGPSVYSIGLESEHESLPCVGFDVWLTSREIINRLLESVSGLSYYSISLSSEQKSDSRNVNLRVYRMSG